MYIYTPLSAPIPEVEEQICELKQQAAHSNTPFKEVPYSLVTCSINLECSLVTHQTLLPSASSSSYFFPSSLLGPTGEALGDGEL